MTISRRKNKPVVKPEDSRAAESGVQYHCDVCGLDISSTVRISCATCASAPNALDTYDLCCCCFLEGAESGTHKAWHAYRVVEQHAYPIFCDDWGADEELLLIDGAQMYGLGNWADIADHIGNRSKEEVQEHYIKVFVEGRDGTQEGDERADRIVREFLEAHHGKLDGHQLPVVGPNLHFKASLDTEEFQKRKRRRIEDSRALLSGPSGSVAGSQQQKDANTSKVAAPPKPLVSAPTSHSELATFMPGRLEFEVEHENDAENYVKDMEFGKVYRYGGEMMPSEMEALGRRADQGRVRMEGSGRGGPGLGSRGGNKGTTAEKGKENEDVASVVADRGKGDEDDDDEKREKGEGEEANRTDEGQHDDEEGEAADEDEGMEEGQTQADASMNRGDSNADAESSMMDTQGDGADAVSTSAAGTASAAASQAVDTDDRAPDWDEEDADLYLKLMVLEIYNERLDRRGRRKEFIFERNLVDYKRTLMAERKRPKEEREMLNRVRHFSQMQTAHDFEEFLNGLCYEEALRRAAAQLQMFRRAGITNLTEATRFETEQTERARRAAVAAEGGLAAFPPGGAVPRSAAARAAARDASTPDESDSATTHGPGLGKKKGAAATVAAQATGSAGMLADAAKKPARKPPRPLDLSSHPSLTLLTRAEQELCSVVRIQPQVYMVMKKDIVVEYVRRKGKFSRRESRQLFKCDVNKVGKVYDLLEAEGFLREAARLGGGWDGIGVPPGWVEPPEKVTGEPQSNRSTTTTATPVEGRQPPSQPATTNGNAASTSSKSIPHVIPVRPAGKAVNGRGSESVLNNGSSTSLPS